MIEFGVLFIAIYIVVYPVVYTIVKSLGSDKEWVKKLKNYYFYCTMID